jgi:hypothetical protein
LHRPLSVPKSVPKFSTVWGGLKRTSAGGGERKAHERLGFIIGGDRL